MSGMRNRPTPPERDRCRNCGGHKINRNSQRCKICGSRSVSEAKVGYGNRVHHPIPDIKIKDDWRSEMARRYALY
jgi:RNA polymerase subunit RPABC4/transcription elongation factor Spt4